MTVDREQWDALRRVAVEVRKERYSFVHQGDALWVRASLAVAVALDALEMEEDL